MEEVKKRPYKYCMVPKCKNTVISTPDKVFFRIPSDVKLREKWCKMMRRDNVSPLSVVFCCEDHFNVKEDTVNYIEYNIMKRNGEKRNLRLKKGVIPHIFLCQKRNMPPPPVERMAVVKWQRLALVNEALSEYAIKSSNIIEIGEPPQRSDYEASPSTSHTNVYGIHQAGPSTSHINVCDINQAGPSTSHINVCDINQAGPSTSHINVCDINQAGPSTSYINVCDINQAGPSTSHINVCDINQAGPSTSHINVCDINQAGPSTSHINVCDINQAGPSTSHINVCDINQAGPSTSNINVCDINQAGPSTSCIEVCNDHQIESCTYIEDKFQSDKAVQVNIKPKYRSKSVNVNIPTEKTNVGLSPLPLSSHNIGTSPIKLSVLKRKLFTDNLADNTSISSLSSVTSTDYAPSCSSELSPVQDDSEDEKHFKKVMCSSMLTAIEKEPKMLLGLPKQSYHLIKLLSDNIPLPTIHILISLKKIKLNESFSILALQFGYSQSTITRVFSKSIPLIAAKLKDLIVWPTPSDIYKNLPISFRSRYANVVSIIDCLEIQIEKPSDAVHQSLTWSQYKKCNTLKYLISCTPDGLVNFISEGYGGRATDVMIVQDCNYLQCLPPNRAVLADRGFKDLSCLLQAKKCTLIRPPSVSKSTPSTKDEVKLSKQIAAIRIHVERVINRLREFHMLLPHACVDHNLIPIIDHVIIIACGLVNMQDVLIKK